MKKKSVSKSSQSKKKTLSQKVAKKTKTLKTGKARKKTSKSAPMKSPPSSASLKANKAPAPSKSKSPLRKPAVEVGSLVPDFKSLSSKGEPVHLSQFAGKKVVLYFYPKDDTPGCTIEGVDFNNLHAEFAAANTVVLGVSRDTVKSHCKFIDKFGFKFDLLSDENEDLCNLFDVIKEKNMYGKISMGIERSTFVIDEKQKLIGEFRKIKAVGHAQEILNFVKGL